MAYMVDLRVHHITAQITNFNVSLGALLADGSYPREHLCINMVNNRYYFVPSLFRSVFIHIFSLLSLFLAVQFQSDKILRVSSAFVRV